MPVHKSRDSTGSYYQWGSHGKKYYYVCGNKQSRDLAKNKATKQGIAAHANGWRGSEYPIRRD